MAINIDHDLCAGCGNCVRACPFGILGMKAGKAIATNPERCRGCRACVSACPQNAIKIG